MREQPAALEPDAQRAEALLRQPPAGLAPRDALARGVPALGEIPHALPLPPADDGDLAAVVEEHSISAIFRSPHQRCASRRVGRVVLDLAGEQRPAPLELAQHVAADTRRSLSGRR